MTHVYVCKCCGRPVEHSVEGELICEACWAKAEMTPEEARSEEDQRWYRSHCEDCGKPLPGGGACPSCQAERRQALIELGFAEANWGDGSLSSEAELRKAALDYRGQP